MIKSQDLVREFQTMYREHWRYEWGKHEHGVVDCSGAFSYAFAKLGGYIYNGSNRIARVYITGSLIPFNEAKQKGLIIPGMAAFKHYSPSSSKYALGAGYKPKGAYYNGDLNDYHHIGLVDDDTNYVLNAQGSKTGFVRSKITDSWTYVAKLKNVEYVGGVEPMPETIMTVIRTSDSASGSKTVNVRSKPDGKAPVMFSVPFGSVVNCYETNCEWSRISYGGREGWMMSKFLASQEQLNLPSDVREFLNKIDSDLNRILDKYGRG